MSKSNTTCYLCGHGEFHVRKGAVRDAPSLKILECAGCGLVTLSALEHIRSGHYEDSGMHGAQPPSIESWLHDTEQDDQRRFDMLKPMLANRRVLDFGCGAAGFVRRAQALTAEVAGIELERRVHEYWGDKIKLHSDLQDAGKDYDIVTAFHVVEHLPDPRAMLKALASRFTPALTEAYGASLAALGKCDTIIAHLEAE